MFVGERTLANVEYRILANSKPPPYLATGSSMSQRAQGLSA